MRGDRHAHASWCLPQACGSGTERRRHRFHRAQLPAADRQAADRGAAGQRRAAGRGPCRGAGRGQQGRRLELLGYEYSWLGCRQPAHGLHGEGEDRLLRQPHLGALLVALRLDALRLAARAPADERRPGAAAAGRVVRECARPRHGPRRQQQTGCGLGLGANSGASCAGDRRLGRLRRGLRRRRRRRRRCLGRLAVNGRRCGRGRRLGRSRRRFL
mmetsp:Transcript_31860/g.105664  ORF Transcript_31860/g.105664 Transcript_31860/m.105664 type:complete len:215 (-) Transcript_31860:351-995(-)